MDGIIPALSVSGQPHSRGGDTGREKTGGRKPAFTKLTFESRG